MTTIRIKGLALAHVLFMGIELDMKNNQREWKARIIREFQESKNLPRKAKKLKRKHLKLDWNIACWDPFS